MNVINFDKIGIVMC